MDKETAAVGKKACCNYCNDEVERNNIVMLPMAKSRTRHIYCSNECLVDDLGFDEPETEEEVELIRRLENDNNYF